MNKKTIIITSSILFLVVVLVGLLGYLFFNQKEKVNNNSNKAESRDNNSSRLNTNSDIVNNRDNTKKEINTDKKIVNSDYSEGAEQNKIKNKAKFFVEMMGTYSPAARFQNIIDLQDSMSYKMKKWSDDFIERNLKNLDENSESVTTIAVNADIVYYGRQDNKAVIFVSTRREKQVDTVQKTYNQMVRVEMIKVGEKWKVDLIEWK